MPEQNNKLFAIISTSFSREDTGRTTPHIFGAIFDVDAHGVATDFTPIDFDGKSIRHWKRNNFGSGKVIDDHFAGAERAIFFPITADTANLLKEAVDDLAQEVKQGRNPFYFELFPKHDKNPKLERYGKAPVDFCGKPVAVSHAERLGYERVPQARAQAATNCVTFLQNVLEKIGGVPLDTFVASDGTSMPRDGDPYRMQDFMVHFAGNKGKRCDQQSKGTLIDLGHGHKAYAYDDRTGWITAALNGLPRLADRDGRTLSVAEYLLQESKPFYNPTLNEHDLGRATPPRGASR